MRVLQIQQSVKDSVRVIEIAPPAETETPSMSVAEAVARHTIGATMESATATNFETRHGHDDTLSQSDDGTNTPLKLDSGELNLDHIESNTNGQQVHASVLAVTPGTTPVSSADHAAASPSVPHTDALMVGGGPDASQSSQSDPHGLTTAPTTAPTAVSAPEPIVAPAPEPTSLPEAANLVSDDNGPDALQPSNASGALPDDSNRKIGDPEPPETHESASAQTPPDAVQGANASAALPGTHESASTQTPPDAVQGANASAALADYPNRNASSSGSSEPRNSAPNDQPSVVVHLPHEPGENVTGSHPGSTDPNATTTNAEDLTHERVSFDHIGEDVVYPPTGTLTPEDDIPYPLPAAVGTDALVSGIHAGAADDIVDFEAIISIAHAHAAPEAFDPTLWRPPGADAQGGHDFCSSQPPHADVDHLDLPGPDQSSHEEHQITPAHHVDI
jgi:hypothetical protein